VVEGVNVGGVQRYGRKVRDRFMVLMNHAMRGSVRGRRRVCPPVGVKEVTHLVFEVAVGGRRWF
jgi:hypothetical protein